MHTPVLLQQAIENLDIKKNGLYIDATFGEGGYSRAILEKGGEVLGIDYDPKQISNFKFHLPTGKAGISNLKLVGGNFANIEKIAKEDRYIIGIRTLIPNASAFRGKQSIWSVTSTCISV